jgi:hypothetical protein
MSADSPSSTPAEVPPTDAGSRDEAVAFVADPALAAPDSPSTTADIVGEPAEVAPVAVAAPVQQVVYVQAPKPFLAKGNRGFGVLIAILSTVIFAALYAVSELLTDLVNGQPTGFGFISSLDFWAPVVVFAVGFVILVLIVNRAGWAAHVLGSLFVGLFVYFASAAAFLALHASTIPSNRIGETYARVLFSVGAIIAALLAREVSLWMGAAVASRGRKVKARNVDARVLYDQEIAAKRAEYERANAASAASVSRNVEAPVVETPTAAEVPATDDLVAEVPPVEAAAESVAP